MFSSPDDPIIFDTGHQSYVHKLLTGRQDFSAAALARGARRLPAARPRARTTSSESSHASSSLSWADGISRAFTATGRADRHVVAVVGDGALTGGMTWEALNNISDDNERNLVIVVNDNGRSYAPTIGGMARYMNRVRTAGVYRDLHRSSRSLLPGLRTDRPGAVPRHPGRYCTASCPASRTTRSSTPTSTSSTWARSTGTTSGRSTETLQQAKDYGAPVIVHVITEKGRGYQPALDDEADQFHAVEQDRPEDRRRRSRLGRGWTDVFADDARRRRRAHSERSSG